MVVHKAGVSGVRDTVVWTGRISVVLLPACVQRACYSMSINLRSHHRSLASGATVLSLSAIVTSVHASSVFILR